MRPTCAYWISTFLLVISGCSTAVPSSSTESVGLAVSEGSDTTVAQANSGATSITSGVEQPSVNLVEPDSVLVMIEARWKCDIQSYSFDNLEDIEKRLDKALAGEGYDRADYDDFKSRLESDEQLRTHVRWQYELACNS